MERVGISPNKKSCREDTLHHLILDQIALNRLNQGENVLFSLLKGSIRADKGGDIAVGFFSVFWNTA